MTNTFECSGENDEDSTRIGVSHCYFLLPLSSLV